MYGTKTAPNWIVVLDAAEAWSMPPWKIADEPKLIWYARYEAYRTAKAKKVKKDANKR